MKLWNTLADTLQNIRKNIRMNRIVHGSEISGYNINGNLETTEIDSHYRLVDHNRRHFPQTCISMNLKVPLIMCATKSR